MNDDHNDFADLFRGHPTIVAPELLSLFLARQIQRRLGEMERQCPQSKSASSS
jgi:hypothetical protein